MSFDAPELTVTLVIMLVIALVVTSIDLFSHPIPLQKVFKPACFVVCLAIGLISLGYVAREISYLV